MEKYLYNTVEKKMQKTMLLLGIPFILGLSLYLTSKESYRALINGLIGKGEGYWFLPSGISLITFMGLF